jgi:hypothetical protein
VLYVSSNKAVLAVNGLPPTQDDTVYKCWWIDNANDILPGNAFKTDAGGTGLWVWQRPAGDEYHTLAITLEHRPDVTKAEGPLILSAGF